MTGEIELQKASIRPSAMRHQADVGQALRMDLNL
jgi:hypothetical protein